MPNFPYLNDVYIKRQPISLKTYEEIFGPAFEAQEDAAHQHVAKALPNGVESHTNGENGENIHN